MYIGIILNTNLNSKPMNITVVKQDNSIEHIYIGATPSYLDEQCKALNSNPLMKSEWTVETVWTDKSMWDLITFLQLNN